MTSNLDWSSFENLVFNGWLPLCRSTRISLTSEFWLIISATGGLNSIRLFIVYYLISTNRQILLSALKNRIVHRIDALQNAAQLNLNSRLKQYSHLPWQNLKQHLLIWSLTPFDDAYLILPMQEYDSMHHLFQKKYIL